MTDTGCSYPGRRDEMVVAYLYEEMASADRVAFEAHLTTCPVCREELAAFGAVRSRLAEWAPPEPTRALTQANEPSATGAARVWAALHDVPAWMQVAAAVLLLGVSAGIANLNVTYNTEGLSIRTGWSRASAVPAGQPGNAVPVANADAAASVVENAATRADLMALEEKVRSEIAALSPAHPDGIREAKVLIAESERKQQNELALRMAALDQDIRTQRTSDLVKINDILKSLESNTRTALARQRDDTVRVSNVVQRWLQTSSPSLKKISSRGIGRQNLNWESP